jgi:hypothetical protein
MATDKYSEKYGQLSGADMEILGAREQAATARALRTAYKPTQGQMVGGWYVKPTWTQNLADAMMQYNNYQDEKAAREQYKALVGQKKQGMKDVATQVAGLDLGQGIPAHQVNVPAVDSSATNAKLDELLAAGYGSDTQGQPLFSDAAPTPSATPSAMPNDGAQAYVAPTAEAQGNTNLGATNNQFVGVPTDSQAMTASDNVPLANAVRNAPLPQAVDGQTTNPAIPPANQASADGTLPAVTVTPEPEPSQLAQMLKGEGQYAPIQKATVRDIPKSGGYSEAAVIAAATAAFQNDQPELGKSLMDYVKERRVQDTAMAGHEKGVVVNGQLVNPIYGTKIGVVQPNQPAAANPGTDYARFNPDTNQWEVNKPVVESKVRIAKEGKTDITTNVNAAVEKSALIESNKNFIDKSYRPAQDTDKANKLVLNRLSALESLPINEKTGWGAEAQAKAAEVLVGMGYKGEEAKQLASNSQTFRAIQARQVNDELNMAKGPQTEGDAVRAKSTFASLGNTPQANQFINDLQRAVIGQRSAEAKFYRDNYAKALRSGDLSSMERDWLDSPEANRSIFDSPAMAKWNKAAPTANPTATYSDSAEEARYQAYKAANPKGK